MLKVMISILKHQRVFFDSMGEHLKPLFEKDVADDISMDISTVSRTVRGKYVQTDFGIYELKYFFSNNVKTEDGEDVSSKELKSKLRDIITGENPLKPFSDDDLTEELSRLGFKIARRTVAKYRESMKIPKARLRRKL
jgi:RNA polymerase sigma-54 factor